MPSKLERIHYSTNPKASAPMHQLFASAMANVSDDQIARFFANANDELVPTGHTSSGGGNDGVDAMLAELEDDSESTATTESAASPDNPEPTIRLATEAPAFPSILALRRARAAAEAKTQSDYEHSLAREKARKQKLNCNRQQRHRDKKRAAKRQKTEAEILAEIDAMPSRHHDPKDLSQNCRLGGRKRLAALLVATANPASSKFLIRIRGRESEIAEAWVIEQYAREKLGERPSQSAVARLHPDKSTTKRNVQSLRDIIATLEAPGGAWHDL